VYFRVRKREGLGFGDVKMVAMIGAFLGLHGALLTVILGSVLGSVLGLLYIFAARKDASSYELPFGTFLGAAALAVAFLREQMLTWTR
jgi:leader peptidase (prepilin peptidase)/N-methyltransferase